jgi:hypothetical protein
MPNLRVHLIDRHGEGNRRDPNVITMCVRLGWGPMSGPKGGAFVYVSPSGKTRFQAVTVDQKPAPGATAVPWVDCASCLRAYGVASDGLPPAAEEAFRDWCRTQPEWLSLDPLTGVRLRERWEKEGRP